MRLNNKRWPRALLLGAMYTLGILGIVASGGGGDSGPTSISYAGNTDPAVISRANATRLVGNIFIGQTIVGSSSGTAFKSEESLDTSSESIGLAHYPSRIILILRNAIQSSPGLALRTTLVRARTDVDETDSCDNIDGSIHITGFIEDNGTGTLTLDFINCRDGNETLDGKVSVKINAFDFGFLIPTDAIYSFSILTLTSSTFNVSVDGSIHSQISLSTQTELLTVSRLVGRNNATGEMLMINNQVSIIDYDNIFSPSSFSETIAGRIYDSTYGYVDFSTLFALNFSTLTQEFPDDGQLLVIGSSNSGIKVTVISDTHTVLDIDLDGDSSFEVAVTLSWTELEAEPDLADSDGDGMHDSWEQVNGLNPNLYDADDDLDNDNIINYLEYLYVTDPQDSSSYIAFTDLSVSQSAYDAVPNGITNMLHTIIVANSGPYPAADVTVTYEIPSNLSAWGTPSVELNISQQLCYITTNVVTCNIPGTMNSGDIATINTYLIAFDIGDSVFTPNSITSSPEHLLDNNSDSRTVSVLTPSPSIQAQIDAAADGDTILISPGMYLGNLFFNGKNLHLESTNGSENTIIFGYTGTNTGYGTNNGINIDSNGSIKGFTITNVSSSAIEVIRGNPINNQVSIIENTFEMNRGEAGVAIQSSMSDVSVTIDRNVFTDNSCDTGGNNSIVLLRIGQSRLTNNLFINNACAGLSSHTFGEPQFFMNNLFIGNTKAIKVTTGVDESPQIYRNNILLQNDIGVEANTIGGFFNPTWDHNLVFGNGINFNGVPDQTGINGNISIDPLLINLAEGDYHLSLGSPGIDTGSNMDAPDIDFDGAPRPVDGDGDSILTTDMGAFEYQ